LFAKDAPQAFDTMSLIGSDVTVVLVDIDLPRVDGFQAIRLFRERYPGLPLLAMSGVVQDHVLQSAVVVGAADALRKPVTAEWQAAIDRVRSRAPEA
jgi:CheY-like chemotaxis protein